MTKKTAGRKPIGEKALTEVEKKRRQRMRRVLWDESAKDSDYTPMPLLLNNKHIRAFNELAKGCGEQFDSELLSVLIFKAAQFYLEQEKFQLEAPKQEDWPKDCGAISMITLNAKLKFTEWEKTQ